jgi:hypothetical protein
MGHRKMDYEGYRPEVEKEQTVRVQAGFQWALE